MELSGTQMRAAAQALSQDGAERIKLLMQVVISGALLTAGIAIILFVDSETTQKIAAGWIGVIVGYWLK